MIKQSQAPFWSSIIRSSGESERQKVVHSVIDGLKKEYPDLVRDIKSSEIIGLSQGLEILKNSVVKGLVFDVPAIVYSNKKYPAIFYAGAEINKNLKEVAAKDEGIVKERHSWVNILSKASPSQKTNIKNAVIEGMTYFNAKWKKDKKASTGYRLLSKDPNMLMFANSLKTNKSLKFVGFCPNSIYLKAKGSHQQLEFDWIHPFSTPTLCFKHTKTPIYFIAGPNIMYNDSMLRVNADNQIYDPVFGITG